MVGSTRDNSLHLTGTKSSKQRRVYLDLINSVAIMWVVLLHVRFITPDNPSSSAWWVENILSGFGVAAVPLFFMATGINLLDFTRRESIGTFYRKRFTKILIPMILWAQVYLFVHMWTGSTPFPGVHEILRTLVAPSSEAATFWYLEAKVTIQSDQAIAFYSYFEEVHRWATDEASNKLICRMFIDFLRRTNLLHPSNRSSSSRVLGR